MIDGIIKKKFMRLSTDCFSASRRIAMTDHFFVGDGGEKEAGGNSAITDNL